MPEKLMILIPAMDTMPTLTAQSLYGLDRPENTPAVFTVGTLVYDARNKLAKTAVEAGADLALWIDSDMSFESDLYRKMKAAMDESGADMVSAMCWRRKPPFELVQYDVLVPGEEEGSWQVRALSEPPEGIAELDGCGFGGVLMKVSVLEDVMQIWDKPFEPTDGLGEDLTFCNRAKMLGKKIVCDGKIRMGHIGMAVYGQPIKTQAGKEPEGNNEH